eukprot:2399237-Amphidinium_carterae.1
METHGCSCAEGQCCFVNRSGEGRGGCSSNKAEAAHAALTTAHVVSRFCTCDSGWLSAIMGSGRVRDAPTVLPRGSTRMASACMP